MCWTFSLVYKNVVITVGQLGHQQRFQVVTAPGQNIIPLSRCWWVNFLFIFYFYSHRTRVSVSPLFPVFMLSEANSLLTIAPYLVSWWKKQQKGQQPKHQNNKVLLGLLNEMYSNFIPELFFDGIQCNCKPIPIILGFWATGLKLGLWHYSCRHLGFFFSQGWPYLDKRMELGRKSRLRTWGHDMGPSFRKWTSCSTDGDQW